jgi:hypothetical protein
LAVLERLVAAFRAVSMLPPFGRDAPLATTFGIIWWWEQRRILFNLVIGTAGAVTTAVALACALLSERYLGEPIGLPDPPMFAVVGAGLFAVVANVLYTGGWITELIVRCVWGEPGADFSRIALFLGLIFSAVVTLSPSVLIGGVTLYHLLQRSGLAP